MSTDKLGIGCAWSPMSGGYPICPISENVKAAPATAPNDLRRELPVTVDETQCPNANGFSRLDTSVGTDLRTLGRVVTAAIPSTCHTASSHLAKAVPSRTGLTRERRHLACIRARRSIPVVNLAAAFLLKALKSNSLRREMTQSDVRYFVRSSVVAMDR